MKISIFIDGGYLGKLLQTKNKKISFQKLNDELSKDEFRVRTYYYTCMPYQDTPPTSDQQRLFQKVDRFHHALTKLPRFEIKLGRLQNVNGHYTQKGVDMQLGVDLVQMSARKLIDVAIIIASDSDFVYAIKQAKEAGVVTILAYFPESNINKSLVDEVDEVIYLDDPFLSKCEF